MNPDGSDFQTIVTNCRFPDGIAVDVEAGHIYWTNMGNIKADDGSIERADLDGSNRTVIVSQGIAHTPKQMHLEKESSKLYWCDREGMRVMRANVDGSEVETLVETGRGAVGRHEQRCFDISRTSPSRILQPSREHRLAGRGQEDQQCTTMRSSMQPAKLWSIRRLVRAGSGTIRRDNSGAADLLHGDVRHCRRPMAIGAGGEPRTRRET